MNLDEDGECAHCHGETIEVDACDMMGQHRNEIVACPECGKNGPVERDEPDED